MANRDYGKSGGAKRMANGGEVEPGMDRAHPASDGGGEAFGGFFGRMFGGRKDGGAPVEDRTPTPVKASEPDTSSSGASSAEASNDEVAAMAPKVDYDAASSPTEKDVGAPKKAAAKARSMPKTSRAKNGLAGGLASGISNAESFRRSEIADRNVGSNTPASGSSSGQDRITRMTSTADGTGNTDDKTMLPKSRMADGGCVGGKHYGKKC